MQSLRDNEIIEFMQSNAAECDSQVSSSVHEFRVHDYGHLSESIAHWVDLSGHVENVLFEVIDFSLELVNWFDSGCGRAVWFSMAPAPGAAVAVTAAFRVIPALVRAKRVLCFIMVAVTCLRKGTDGSNGNSEFHFLYLKWLFNLLIILRISFLI